MLAGGSYLAPSRPCSADSQVKREREEARDYLRTQPGYIDTVLHQALTPDAEFQFVNVARWRTAEDFTAATRGPGFRESHPASPAPGRAPISTGPSAPDTWPSRRDGGCGGGQPRGRVRGNPKRAMGPRSAKRVIAWTWLPRSASTMRPQARQIGALGSGR